ncbi:MAG: hypothetical protein ABSA62_12820, partial [Methyloceanibacter sp.]
ADAIVTPDPAQCDFVAAASEYVTIEGLIGNVQPVAREAVEKRPCLFPGKGRSKFIVILKIGPRIVTRSLPDRFTLPCR